MRWGFGQLSGTPGEKRKRGKASVREPEAQWQWESLFSFS